MEKWLNAVSVPVIAAIVYCVIKIITYATGNNEKFKRFIPLIAAALGCVFGVICYFAVPSIIPTDNVVVAIVIGGASGLTATGTNQLIKQLSKKPDDKKTDEKEDKKEE